MGDAGGVRRLAGRLVVLAAQLALLTAFSWQLTTHPSVAARVTLVVGEVVVLGAGFMQKVWEILEAEWAKGLATWINSTLTRRLAGYGQSYRQCVRRKYRYFDEAGLSYRGEYPVDIEDVVVDVRLMPRPPGQISRALIPAEPADPGPGHTRDRIWHFLDAGKSEPVRLAIIGAPGSGKTTLLRHITLTLAGKRRRRTKPRHSFPILLSLRECAGEIIGNAKTLSLPTLIEAQVKQVAGEPPADWFRIQLEAGRCVVMFDGADEIAAEAERQAVLEWIQSQAARYGRNDYIVTSRPLKYWEYSFEGGAILQVREFTTDQIGDFVNAWYRASERGDKASEAVAKLLTTIDKDLAKLATNPLLLTMICQVNRNGDGELPTTRPALYKEFCDVLLEKRQHGKMLPNSLAPGQPLSVLRKLAFTMMEGRPEKPSADEMAAMLKRPLGRISREIEPADFLNYVCDTGLLTESASGGYGFVHQTFCEYLTATAISESGQLSVLLDNVADQWWRETILFYAAIRGADQIVEACLDSDTLAAIALAFECADLDHELASCLRTRLTALLAEAIDPKVAAERRRLAAAVIATRQLRPDTRLDGDVRMCDAPVSRGLFRIFVSQSRPQFPTLGVTADLSDEDDTSAVSVKEPEVLAFLAWLNSLSDDQWLFRLPTRAEADKAKLASGSRCVWLASASDARELDLWMPPGTEHPYAVSEGELRRRAEADSAGQLGDALATALAFALVHTLAVTDTLLTIRRPQPQTLATEIRQKLSRLTDQARHFIDRLAPVAGNNLSQVLNGTLNSLKSSAMSEDFASALTSALVTTGNLPPARALDLAIDLARFRASDLAASIRVLRQQESVTSVARPASRARDLTAASGRTVAAALDQALDRALRWASHSELDLDVPMCLLLARQLPVDGQQRSTLDPIAGPAFRAVMKQRRGQVVLPGSLTRRSAQALKELTSMTMSDSSQAPPADRLIAVGSKVHDLVEKITDPAEEVTSESFSYARMGAISLAANLVRQSDGSSLASSYLDIAFGVTSVERQFLGQEKQQELMILVQA